MNERQEELEPVIIDVVEFTIKLECNATDALKPEEHAGHARAELLNVIEGLIIGSE